MIELQKLSDKYSDSLLEIINKIQNNKRINNSESIIFLKEAPISLLGLLANQIREQIHGDTTYFNKNIHIEPTNICVFDCKFCAYSRLLREK